VNPGFNPFLLIVTFGPWAAGEFVRSRRRLAAELAEAGKLLEAERSRYADEAVRYERVHLARELHDTVAHWLTAVVIQARAGQVRSLTRPESMAATFADIGLMRRSPGPRRSLAGTALRLTHCSSSRLAELAATRAPGYEPHDDDDGHRDQPDDDKRLERSHDPGRSRDGKPYGEDRAEDCPDDPAHASSMPRI
jgi:hypothetical protein